MLVVQAPSLLASQLLEALSTVLEPVSAIYCSAPITTGRRYFELLERDRSLHWRTQGAAGVLREKVVEPNSAAARSEITRLRRTGEIVIDPTRIEGVPDWSQEQWHHFWEAVIKRFAKAVVFVDGWEYSNGCSFEFLVAHKNRIPALTSTGSPITLASGIRMIAAAVERIEHLDEHSAFLQGVLLQLKAPSIQTEPSHGTGRSSAL